jgi:STE24 endopeptidase
VNETKSARYHRLNRRAAAASLICAATMLGALLSVHASVGVVTVCLLLEAAAFPFAFYRSFVLERRYELSVETPRAWLVDYAKALGLSLATGVCSIYVMYAFIRWNAQWWWLPMAVAAAAVALLTAKLAPFLLRMFYKFTPLDRASLVDRLTILSARAGTPVLGVYEWGLGQKTRRANALLVGSGATRRILLSDTLLADYTDDEIEVILAHEMAHHVHHDIARGLALETILLLASALASALTLNMLWQPLGLASPADIAGLPLLLLVGGGAMLAARPIAHAFSRSSERRADRFALDLTDQHPAFVSAMRRLALQNLAEESPSRATVVLFHTHPPVEERIGAARAAPVS